jgi:hypothetical protein
MADLLRAGVGAGALLAGIGVFFNYVVTVPHERAAQQRITQQERLVHLPPNLHSPYIEWRRVSAPRSGRSYLGRVGSIQWQSTTDAHPMDSPNLG